MKHTTENPLVSIIVPTYNSGHTLRKCLNSIVSQTYKNVEIIVVDNFSQDNTIQICKDFNVKYIQVSAIRSKARLIGAKLSKGEYLLHIDSDMELTPRVIEECIRLAKTKGADAVVIPEINIGETYWAKCTNFGKVLSNLCKRGYLRFIKREVYFEIGGHDPTLVAGEDKDLHDRTLIANKKVIFSSELILHHIGDVSLKDIIKKVKFYSKTLPRFYAKHKTPLKENRCPKKLLRLFLTDPLHGIGYLFLMIITFMITLEVRRRV